MKTSLENLKKTIKNIGIKIRDMMGKGNNNPFVVGEKYFIRTVTMALTGRLVKVYSNELVLENAAWIADTGRFTDFLKNGVADEVEPFPDGEIIVGRNSIIDACKWNHKLLRNQK